MSLRCLRGLFTVALMWEISKKKNHEPRNKTQAMHKTFCMHKTIRFDETFIK